LIAITPNQCNHGLIRSNLSNTEAWGNLDMLHSIAKALAIVLLVFLSKAADAGLKETIAEKFGVVPNAFVLNLPPRPGCLPGSIFTDDLRVPLSRTKLDDPKFEFGPTFQFSAEVGSELGANAGGGISDWFGVAAKASAVSNAVIEFKNARVIELLGPELKRRVLADPDALAAAARKIPPFAVLRAFQGTATLTLTKKDAASADAWAKVKETAVQANVGASASADDKLVISVGEPFVFGFEVVQLNYVTQHLGSTVDDVNLVKIPEDLFQR
jgi:hypothetical protein